LIAMSGESLLWWTMLSTGVMAAVLSITTNLLDRQKAAWPTRQQRFLMHMVSYGFLTISVLVFVVRGLLSPT
jgi:hypothetical protein